MKMNIDIAFKYNMLPPGTRVLCAVSGGADSMCLLHLLLSLREKLGIEVFAAHFEHGIRGEESLRDADFVENWCRDNNVNYITASEDVPGYAKSRGMGLEEAARELRYKFLNAAAEHFSCSKIATAHNADDNAETMLFNLCRGSGSAGLRGIPPVRGNIIRPLLGCTRAEIEKYLEENHVPHVEDSSNASDDYSRNLIRHKIMPVLREINPEVSAAALRGAELMREDEKCLENLAEKFLADNFDGRSIDCEKLLSQELSLASRAIRKLCPGLSYRHVEAVLEFAGMSGLGYLDLPKIRLRREQGRLYFGDEEKKVLEERTLIPGEPLIIPEAGLKIEASCDIKNEEVNDLFKTYLFKYKGICGNIKITSRKTGDNIRPLGRNCSKSLKKLFTEAGYTQAQRDTTPVFRDEKGVLAVYGLAADERTAADKGEEILKIQIEKYRE